MALLPATNSKSKQTCVAQVEVPPEEAEAFFDKDYALTVGGRVYEAKDSTDFTELAPLTVTYHIPAADFTFAPFEDQTTDTQILVEESFYYGAEEYLGVAGEAKQSLFAGFETQPYDDTASDALGFAFELLAPTEVFTPGKVVYQWLTYAKADDFKSNPASVGCVTKVGNPFVAEVQTFNGTRPMSSEGSTVVNRTWDQQNVEDKAPKKDSFEILQDLEWYELYKENDSESVMPCFAKVMYDGKLDATNPIFGVYNVTLGGRVYANDSDTSPMTLPEQSLQIEFTQPESDLSNVYEEKDVPEEKAAEVIYLDDKFRFKALDVWPAHTGDEKFAWLRVRGGYKLYGTSGAEDRWFWNFGLEYPTALVQQGEQLFFWLKYADDALSEDLTGAVACKIETGDNLKTAVSQWTGDVNMHADSADVVGKKWYKQNKLGKMSVPDYYALFYKEDIFTVQESPRTTGGYSVQQCEVEIKLPEGATPDTVTLTMETGVRFYASNDATTFLTTPEKEYDWYNEVMEFSNELKEVAVYEDKQPTKAVEEAFEFDVTNIFGAAIAEFEAAQQAAAEAAAQAEADAQAAADAAADSSDTADANGNMVAGMRSRQEAATYSAS
mgnify:FL=1